MLSSVRYNASCSAKLQFLRMLIVNYTQLLRIYVAYFLLLWYIFSGVIKVTLKELRKQKKLTQIECAAYLNIPIRTYQNYESDVHKQDSMKYLYMMQKLEQYGYTDETHGILTIQRIKNVCREVFPTYGVVYCYLFGSYAKAKATETSDVDLLISTSATGMKYYELMESLREGLGKKVDMLSIEQLVGNPELINEILKDGVKIYG